MDPEKTAVKEEGKEKGTATGTETVIEEGDLLKSIKEIETKAKGDEKVEEKVDPDPKVATAEVEGLAKTVDAEGSDELKKGLEVSSFLKEFVDLCGLHIDNALSTLSKSLNATAERDNAFLKVIEAFGTKIEGLAKSVKDFGDLPTAAAGTKKPGTVKEEVLEKGAEKEGDPAAKLSQAEIFTSLESLVKSASDTATADRWSRSLIKYDSTKVLDLAELRGVMAEHKRLNGTAVAA